jgi:heat shock protein HslJ
MRVPRSVLVLSIAVVVAAGCTMFADDNANGGLVNTSWTVITIDGAQTLDEARPTMVFAPEGLSGTTGCNSYGGTFRTDDDRITINVGAMTEMACDGPRGAQEVAFIDALATVTSWRLREDGALELGGGAAIVAMPADLVVVPQDDDPDQPVTDGALPGSTWTLVAIDATEDLAGIVPTLEFGQAGSLAGLAGCNRFNGAFTLDGSAIEVGPLGATKMACGDPADAVERLYLGVLGAVATWSIGVDKRLVLEGPAGSLTFTAG